MITAYGYVKMYIQLQIGYNERKNYDYKLDRISKSYEAANCDLMKWLMYSWPFQNVIPSFVT